MATEKKRRTQVKPVIDLNANTVTFEIDDGQEPLVLHMDRLHPAIIRQAAFIGMAQTRIVDAAAVNAEDDNGNVRDRAARLALKRERMKALVDHYETGTDEWSRKERAGGSGSIRILAVQRVRGISTYAEAKTRIQEYADRNYEGNFDEALEFLAAAPKVQDMLAQIQRERLGEAKIDADSAIDEI